MSDENDSQGPAHPRIKLLGKEFRLPRSRRARVTVGSGLVVGGMLGFLPVLGFWMLPLGIIVLSYEFALVRRQRRRAVVWWGRRRTQDAKAEKKDETPPGQARSDPASSLPAERTLPGTRKPSRS